MKNKKEDPNKPAFSIVAAAFWVSAISVTIFINISSKALVKTNFLFLVGLLVAFCALIIRRILLGSLDAARKAAAVSGICALWAAGFLLFQSGHARTAGFYLLPAIVSVSMAVLVVLNPTTLTIAIVAVCTFLLGEGFWGISITSDQRLRFPEMFMRIFSLTLVSMFAYYLYRKEIVIRKELIVIGEKKEAFSRMKSTFVANISHELRTPVTVLDGAFLLLKEKIVGAKKNIKVSEEELFRIIKTNLRRQSLIINDLLKLSNIEEVGLTTPLSCVDVKKAAEEVFWAMKDRAMSKGVELASDIQPGMPGVYALEGRITEIYKSLLDNSLACTDKGGSVSLRVKAESGGIKSEIEDTGAAMSQRALEKLFDPDIRLQEILEEKDARIDLQLV
ncbi:MAG: HAMP domain-containing sensor histidine kinase, partial [Candidatus Omnitrophota bacterium]